MKLVTSMHGDGNHGEHFVEASRDESGTKVTVGVYASGGQDGKEISVTFGDDVRRALIHALGGTVTP